MGAPGVIAGAGLILQVAGEKKRGDEAASAKRGNAAIARRNAKIAQDRARIRVGQIEKEGVSQVSTVRALTGASGVKAGSGSVQTLIRETRKATAEDIAAVRLLGEREATDLKAGAKQLTSEARAIGAAQPLLTAGTVLSGGAQIFNQFAKPPGTV